MTRRIRTKYNESLRKRSALRIVMKFRRDTTQEILTEWKRTVIVNRLYSTGAQRLTIRDYITR